MKSLKQLIASLFLRPKTNLLKTGVKVYLDGFGNVTNVTSPYDSNNYYQQPLKF